MTTDLTTRQQTHEGEHAVISTSPADFVAKRVRAIGGIGILSLSMLAGTAGIAQAASVTPMPINGGNPTCDDFAEQFGGTWTELKIEGADLANGTVTDGTLEFTISNFVASDSGTPGSFDWSSNIGVDAVFVKAGQTKHNLYVYDPEATSDTGLSPQAGQGNGISHISVCYDDDPEPTPTPTPEITPTPTPTGSELPVEPSPTPTGQVGGVVGTPQPTPPPTDAFSGGSTDGSVIPAMFVLGGMLGGIAVLSIRKPSRARR